MLNPYCHLNGRKGRGNAYLFYYWAARRNRPAMAAVATMPAVAVVATFAMPPIGTTNGFGLGSVMRTMCMGYWFGVCRRFFCHRLRSFMLAHCIKVPVIFTYLVFFMFVLFMHHFFFRLLRSVIMFVVICHYTTCS